MTERSSKRPELQGWQRRERPLRLERRIEFPDYEDTRVFLDALGALCEETGVYPNQSFGRTYVNLTLFADEGGELTEEAHGFAERTETILSDLSGETS
jgi:pterin-4a-carbinolamine dehydratase